MSTVAQKTRIAQLNDRFRKGDSDLGLWSMTSTVSSLPKAKKQALLEAVQSSDNFIETQEVSPYQEHDFGLVTQEETDYFWEIDYCDKNLKLKSPNPADPSCTMRVLTLMRADEY